MRNLTLHYDRMMLMLDPTPLAHGLAGKKVEVVNYPDGRLAILFDGRHCRSGCSTRSRPWKLARLWRTNGWVRCWRW